MKNSFTLKEINPAHINIDDVRKFAFKKHEGQIRPNIKKEPKTIHLSEVADLVKKANGNIFAIASAYLHDTVEDTQTSIQEIIDRFGPQVGMLVDELTDPEDFYALPLAVRKEKQTQKIKSSHNDTKLVKMADQISNCQSVLTDPPIDWDNEKCLNYIIGAKKIVDACTGTNSYLEAEFMNVYLLGVKKYKALANSA